MPASRTFLVGLALGSANSITLDGLPAQLEDKYVLQGESGATEFVFTRPAGFATHTLWLKVSNVRNGAALSTAQFELVEDRWLVDEAYTQHAGELRLQVEFRAGLTITPDEEVMTFAVRPGLLAISSGASVTGGTALVTIAQQLNLIQSQVGNHKSRLEYAEPRISSTIDRVTTAEGQIVALTTRLDTAEGDLTAVTTRVTTAEGAITSLTTVQGTLQGNVTALQTLTQAHDDELNQVEGQIAALQTQQATNTTQIGNLQGRVSTNEGAIGSLNGTVTTLSSQVGTLQAAIGTLTAQMSLANSEITALKSRVTALENAP